VAVTGRLELELLTLTLTQAHGFRHTLHATGGGRQEMGADSSSAPWSAAGQVFSVVAGL
jgi:hypothetical protein